MTRLAVTVALAASLLAAAGCGDGSTEGSATRTLHVYSSLPLQGAQRAQSQDVVNGIRIALEEAKGRAGSFKLQYTSLDDSTAQAGAWTPEATQANARRVSMDEQAVGYIGEANSGATAISLPLLNEAGVPQISYSNTAVGLTTKGAGATAGEPEKYYPAGRRTYVRIVPRDTVQGAALVTLMTEDGCTKVAMANDKEVYGAGVAQNVAIAAERQGLRIISNDGIEKYAPNYRSLAAKARTAGADCFIYAGITPNNAGQLFKDFAAALPGAGLYGPDGIAETGFTDPGDGGVPADVARHVKATIATLAPEEYPPSAQRFFDAYARRYGERHPNPYALYGYEAMSLLIDAIERSETGEREDVVRALFETKDRRSVLGTYSIDENGDTTLTAYGVYTIAGGRLEFERTIDAGG